MNYQRSYKTGKKLQAGMADRNPRGLTLRRSMKTLNQSDKKSTHKKREYSGQGITSMSLTGSKLLRQSPAHRRIKTQVQAQNRHSEKPSSEIVEDKYSKQKTIPKLSRYFIVRQQPNLRFRPNQPKTQIPKVNHSKTSSKEYGVIKAYAANTHGGLYRQYNEDRISISLNLDKQMGVHCFGVFDGHGGTTCAQFLSTNLFDAFAAALKDLGDPKTTIIKSFEQMQAKFLELAKAKDPVERSGSCALIAVTVGEDIYIANIGDSRAILLQKNQVIQITEDHKPMNFKQRQRIQASGGKIYQTKLATKNSLGEPELGPCRVWPGRLSVSRTLGDIQAKDTQLGGITGVVSPHPQIYTMKAIKGSTILLGCDGIFDRLSNQDICYLFSALEQRSRDKTIHQISGQFVEECIRQSMIRDSYDNLSAISITF